MVDVQLTAEARMAYRDRVEEYHVGNEDEEGGEDEGCEGLNVRFTQTELEEL
jgi:predicted Ser/Thr protein kinase